MTRIAQTLTATLMAAGAMMAALPAAAQDKPTFTATFTKGKQPAADIPVTLLTDGAPNDRIDLGRTNAMGGLTLDAAIGGLKPGKPMTVTQRECEDGDTSLFIGDTPPEEKHCNDRELAAFLWGDGDHTFSLAAGGVNWGLWGPVAAGVGAAAAFPAFRNGSDSGGGAPGGQTPGGGTGGGGTGGGGTGGGGGGTTPSLTSLNGNYVGMFTRISDSCNFFFPGFPGTLNITATDSGSLTASVIEQITRIYIGALQVPSAGNGTGSGTGSGTLPGNVPYTAQLTVTIANNQATAEETVTLPGMGNCVGRLRGTNLVKQ